MCYYSNIGSFIECIAKWHAAWAWVSLDEPKSFTADIYWANRMEYTVHMWLQVHQRPLTIIIWKWVETQTSVNMDKATTIYIP